MSQTFGKTRWKRFALVMVPSIAATAAIGVSIANSALAASFAVSGQYFKVTADDLNGDNFAQFGGVDGEPGYDKDPTKNHPVAISTFDTAKIEGMCQSVKTNLGVLGDWTLVLKAGDKGRKVEATNLIIDLNQLEADAVFTDINIGQDASTLPGPAADLVRKQGKLPTGDRGFAQAAKNAHLTKVKQTAWATSAGTFTLNDLRLNIVKGAQECY
ncbi:DUF6230 family protein [Kitasatospora sp. NPDC002040]|uniref:DUF6230 family protein n=1 Tax=Kitasatospora sp. NPDC002040 TaxID=3154661 RepID=UPI003316784D